MNQSIFNHPKPPRRSRIFLWLKRIGLGLFLLMALLLVAGAIYEMASRRDAARRYPPKGKLVDIGGRLLHLDCRGHGSPLVLFEAGLDDAGSLSWAGVHDAVAARTRACAYDRAGIMWSNPKKTAQNGPAIADDLHAALAAAGEKAPFILVAHSLGGPYAMTYTRKYGDQVAGLVFVDASHPDQATRLAAVIKGPTKPSATMLRIFSSLSWTGIVRLMRASEEEPNTPAGVTNRVNAYASTSLAGVVSEIEGFDQTMADARSFRTLGARPLVVLTAMTPIPPAVLESANLTKQDGERLQRIRKAMHQEQASWSTRSRQQLVPDASHYIQFDRPDLVIKAIRDVVDAVRADQAAQLPSRVRESS